MKPLLALLCFGTFALAAEVEPTNDSLRVFLVQPSEVSATLAREAFTHRQTWAAVPLHDFMLFHLRDGSEFGRQVPVLWVYRKDAKYALAIVDEQLLFSTEFKNPRVEVGDVLVFDLAGGAKARTVKIPLIWQQAAGMIFAARRGVEFVR